MSFSSNRRALGFRGSKEPGKAASITLTFHVEDELDVFTVGPTNYQGLDESSRSFRHHEDGSVYVDVTYEGFPDSEGDPSEEESLAVAKWEVDYEFSEEPIEAHPKIEKIKENYGGVVEDGEITFPEKLPSKVSSENGLGGVSRKKGDRNPLFGQETYPRLTTIVSVTYGVRSLPSDLANRAGQILDNIPNAPNSIARLDTEGRNWFRMPPKVKQRGGTWEITEEYRLSLPDGWTEELVDVIER